MKYNYVKTVKPHCVDCKQVSIHLMINAKNSYMCRPCKATRMKRYYNTERGREICLNAKRRQLAKKALLNKA